ncbi:MAG: cation:proton antiporter [Myxococcaceae bacterium]
MVVFEWVLALLLGSVMLGFLARRIGAPYPSLLAIAGTGLALLPFAPRLSLPPDLALALFVAPVLLDAAFDAPVRDIRRYAGVIASLVLVAVGLTTAVVAVVARSLEPAMPWAAAMALGAIVAPPDAAAALAVLKQLRPPHRVLVILEGESLLNDATALLIYRLAVGAVAAGGLSAVQVAPTLLLVVIGSIGVGAFLGWAFTTATRRIEDVPSAIILQFVGTFGVWLLADGLHLSGVLTIVAFAVVASRLTALIPARMRVASFAVWETGVYVLNVIAFVLMGLQIRPILQVLDPSRRTEYFVFALAVLAAAVLTRMVWVMIVTAAWRWEYRRFGARRPRPWPAPSLRRGLVVGWCGMRGLVTLAAAYGLPHGFPFRDLILLTAFAVVLGTLTVQGLTLRPLVRLLGLRPDHEIDREIRFTREAMARAALDALEGVGGPFAEALRLEHQARLDATRSAPNGFTGGSTEQDVLRRTVVEAQRRTLAELRRRGEIADDAFHRVEEELDWAELSALRTDVS